MSDDTYRLVALALLDAADEDGSIEPFLVTLAGNQGHLDPLALVTLMTSLISFIALLSDQTPSTVIDSFFKAAPTAEQWQDVKLALTERAED
jgi:hypothetical protein